MFHMTTTKWMKATFLVATSGAYCMDHLKCTNQLSDVLAKTHHLQVFLVDELGGDCLDWLPDAPDALKICSELEIAKVLK